MAVSGCYKTPTIQHVEVKILEIQPNNTTESMCVTIIDVIMANSVIPTDNVIILPLIFYIFKKIFILPHINTKQIRSTGIMLITEI